jgi:hypothetical protein
MYPLRDHVDERIKMALGGESPEKGVGRGDRHQIEFMNAVPGRPCAALLTRILELHFAGKSADDIAVQVLTADPENAMFRAAMSVEIILCYASRNTEGENSQYVPNINRESD